jgi:hypothetical protein
MESAKYQAGGSNDVISTDGGPLASVYEKGSELGLEPLDYGDPTLVGWWPLTEGTGTVAYDDSGNNATGSWSGTPAGTSGYYSAGKVGAWAGYFDGTDNYVSAATPNIPTSGAITISLWLKSNTASAEADIVSKGTLPNNSPRGFYLDFVFGTLCINAADSSYVWHSACTTSTFNNNNWHYVAAFIGSGGMGIYVDDSFLASNSQSSYSNNFSSYNLLFGEGAHSAGSDYFGGLIDDIRIYSRALSAAQIAAIYAGEK